MKALCSLAATAAAAALAAACSHSPVVCTTELRENVAVLVRDSVTGAPAAAGATGYIQAGPYASYLVPIDSLHMVQQSWGEYAGTYTVRISKPGYREWARSGIEVKQGVCHVITATITALLVPTA